MDPSKDHSISPHIHRHNWGTRNHQGSPCINGWHRIGDYNWMDYWSHYGSDVSHLPVFVVRCERSRLRWRCNELFSFQFLGSCEYNNARPQKLDWYFNFNCLGTKLSDIDSGNIEVLVVSNGECMNSGTPPVVTGYRLLASMVFVLFGLVKMICAYLGFSSAMNALDWVIAVPLTLGWVLSSLLLNTPYRSIVSVYLSWS